MLDWRWISGSTIGGGGGESLVFGSFCDCDRLNDGEWVGTREWFSCSWTRDAQMSRSAWTLPRMFGNSSVSMLALLVDESNPECVQAEEKRRFYLLSTFYIYSTRKRACDHGQIGVDKRVCEQRWNTRDLSFPERNKNRWSILSEIDATLAFNKEHDAWRRKDHVLSRWIRADEGIDVQSVLLFTEHNLGKGEKTRTILLGALWKEHRTSSVRENLAIPLTFQVSLAINTFDSFEIEMKLEGLD